MAESEEQTPPSRRTFLANGIKALCALFGLTLGVPLAGFSFSPAWKRAKHDNWLDIAKVSDLQASRPTKITYHYIRKDGWTDVETRKMAFIVRGDDGALAVLSNRCTHLGCGVDWDATANEFRCPCHGGVFDLQGRVVEGPPPKPLTRLASKVENGSILIREA
jgi:Rieske Fe-S protein